MLEATNLFKSFGDLKAVDGISFSVGEQSDDIVFIVGPNGAGKTTLVNLLTGYISPERGSVVMDGEDITKMSPHKRVHEGLVRSFQIVDVFEEMTVQDNIRMALLTRENLTGKKFRFFKANSQVEEELHDIVDRFDLSEVAEMRADELPHGTRKLLDIAISYALDPKYLLLDEPTSGVSTSDKDDLITKIIEINKNESIVTVAIEHDMDLVREYGDRLIALYEGQILTDGDPSLLDTDAELREKLLGEI